MSEKTAGTLMRDAESSVLDVTSMSTTFQVKGRKIGQKHHVKAVRDICFSIAKGETYALVGESGCGKTTTGRTIIGLEKASAGSAMLNGKELLGEAADASVQDRRKVQMIFQDPYSSLNPKKRVGEILMEALKVQASEQTNEEAQQQILAVLQRVGFGPEHYYRFPHEFSGGQRQRIGIARALLVSPDLIICDEAVSALDVSIQAQILNLLQELQDETQVSYLFVSHDLGVVRYIADRIGVMYLGEIVEEASSQELFSNPKHPYTQSLLSAVPIANPELRSKRLPLEGEVPSPLNPPPGCVFSTRCPMATELCRTTAPNLEMKNEKHLVSCHFVNPVSA